MNFHVFYSRGKRIARCINFCLSCELMQIIFSASVCEFLCHIFTVLPRKAFNAFLLFMFSSCAYIAVLKSWLNCMEKIEICRFYVPAWIFSELTFYFSKWFSWFLWKVLEEKQVSSNGKLPEHLINFMLAMSRVKQFSSRILNTIYKLFKYTIIIIKCIVYFSNRPTKNIRKN